MSQEPKVTIITKGQTSILEIIGDVTTFAEKPISAAYQQATAAESKNVILKFSKSSFINSAGIGIIISLLSESRKHKQSIAVCGLSAHFEKIFDMIGLTDYIKLYPNEEKALQSFRE